MTHPKRAHLNALTLLAAALALPAVRADETNALSFAYSDISANLVRIESWNSDKKSTALGVVATMEGKPYLLTNQHTLLGAERLKFTTASGEALAPTGVELSRNRDLARLALPERGGALSLAQGKPEQNSGIVLARISDDAENRLQAGSITGLGGMKLEISTAFAEPDHGAPILNANKEIVGIATQNKESSKHAMKLGTRFENAERYFCYRVETKSWQRVNWRKYDRLFGAAYRDSKELGDEIMAALEKQKGRIDSTHAKKLASRCRAQAREIAMLSDRSGITTFLRDELEGHAELFEYAEKYFTQQATR